MECYCYLSSIQDILSDGKTPPEWRFGEPFTDPIKPFGARVECHSMTTNDQAGLHQCGKNVFCGILWATNALYVGGNREGDLLVADVEESQVYVSSEVYVERLKKKFSC